MNTDQTPNQRRESILSGLTDLGFEQMVTPRLIGCLYMAALAFIASGTLFALLLVWGMSTWLGAGWCWVLPVVLCGALVAVLAARIACEWILMTFTHGHHIATLREQYPPVQGPWAERRTDLDTPRQTDPNTQDHDSMRGGGNERFRSEGPAVRAGTPGDHRPHRHDGGRNVPELLQPEGHSRLRSRQEGRNGDQPGTTGAHQ